MSTAEQVPETTVDALPDPLPSGVSILDVREPHEWAAGHVPGAVHIPLGQLPGRAGQVPAGEVLVVCHLGGRSARATAFLRQQGVPARNLGGGMQAWAAAGRPIVSETDRPARVV